MVKLMIPLFTIAACLAGAALAAAADTLPKADPFPKKELDDHIAAYMKVRKQAIKAAPPLKPKAEPEAIEAHKLALAQAIRDARKEAKQGDVFTPAIQASITRIVASETKGKSGAPAKAATKQGNPAIEGPAKPVVLKVNQPYPKDEPLSTVPPSILLRLPELPKELSFRFVGRHLILHDETAGIIVDFMLNVTK